MIKLEDDKNIKINIISQEEDLFLNRTYNLYSILKENDKFYIEYSKTIKDRVLYIKERVFNIGAVNDGIFLKNTICEGLPLTGSLDNGLNFYYSKIISIDTEKEGVKN